MTKILDRLIAHNSHNSCLQSSPNKKVNPSCKTTVSSSFSSPLLHPHLSQRSEPKARSTSIEDSVISVEENITVDVLGSTSNTLEGPEASVSTSGSEVEERSRDGGVGRGADAEGEGGECGRAGEGVATLGRVVRGAGDGGILFS
jgi:hypothetical protein